MLAWRVHGYGEPHDQLVLEEVAEPGPGDLSGLCVDLCGLRPVAGPEDTELPAWVLLRVRAASLALPDVTMCRGSYPVEVPRPYTTGQEAVGVVERASPGMESWLGRRVVAFTPQPFGSLAPVAVGLPGAIYDVPEGLDDASAAAFLIASHTAYHALCRRGGLRSGETVLVLGAAGGLGTAAVQLARARGARVLAAVGGPEKVRLVRELGADVAIDHRAEDLVEAVRKASDGRGVDVIFDPVQGEMGERVRACLVAEGRHVLCGHAGGLRPIDPRSFYMQNYTLVGATMGAYPAEQGYRIEQEAHRAIVELLETGRFRPVVGRTIDFHEVPAALTDLAERRTLGRVVVRVS